MAAPPNPGSSAIAIAARGLAAIGQNQRRAHAIAAREFDCGAGQQVLAGAHQGFPTEWLKAIDQKHFDAPAEDGLAARCPSQPPADEPRRKDARVVQDQHIAAAQIIRQMIEDRVARRARRPVNNQQP